MLHYIDPPDKSTWPPRNSYFYAKLKRDPYWDNPLDRYIFLYEFYEVLGGYDVVERFIEAGGEQYCEVAPEEIEYWLSFDELDECIKFFEENLSKEI